MLRPLLWNFLKNCSLRAKSGLGVPKNFGLVSVACFHCSLCFAAEGKPAMHRIAYLPLLSVIYVVSGPPFSMDSPSSLLTPGFPLGDTGSDGIIQLFLMLSRLMAFVELVWASRRTRCCRCLEQFGRQHFASALGTGGLRLPFSFRLYFCRLFHHATGHGQ